MAGCIGFALCKASRELTRFYNRALKPHRLRVTQLPILVAASRHGAVPLASLAETLGMDRTTLLRNVRPLVRRGLVQVSPAADSRRTEVRATARGKALMERAYPAWKKAQARALHMVPGDWPLALEALARGLRSGK